MILASHRATEFAIHYTDCCSKLALHAVKEATPGFGAYIYSCIEVTEKEHVCKPHFDAHRAIVVPLYNRLLVILTEMF